MRAIVYLASTTVLTALTACSPSTSKDPQGVAKDSRFILGRSKSTSVESAESEQPSPPQPRLGVGKPDETNGECRLFAKEFKEPTCCPRTYGLGAKEVQEICSGVALLGEHLREGCGYYFLEDASGQVQWLRVSFIAETFPAKEAISMRDAYLKKRTRDPDFASTPIPGVEGGAYNVVNEIGWALLPGWARLRQAGWSEGFCGDQLPKLLECIATAPEPQGDPPAFRDGLLPSRLPVDSPVAPPPSSERPLG